MVVGRGLIYPFYKEVVELISHKKRVTTLVWHISNADGEEVEQEIRKEVNMPNL